MCHGTKKTTTESNANQNEEPNKEADKKELETRKEEIESIPQFTEQEVQAAIGSHKKKESPETTMEPKLNTSKDALRRQNMIREIFNDVIMCKDITPDVWKRVRITEVFKKSDVARADNYRPICNAACTTGFTTSFTEDNLLTREGSAAHRKHRTIKRHTGCLNKKCRVWRVKMWIATVDFAKHHTARSTMESLSKIRSRSAVH